MRMQESPSRDTGLSHRDMITRGIGRCVIGMVSVEIVEVATHTEMIVQYRALIAGRQASSELSFSADEAAAIYCCLHPDISAFGVRSCATCNASVGGLHLPPWPMDTRPSPCSCQLSPRKKRRADEP